MIPILLPQRSCLLEHECLLRASTVDDSGAAGENSATEIDVPLAHLIRNAERICGRIYQEHTPGTFIRKPVQPPYVKDYYGRPPSRLQVRVDNVPAWMPCVAAFARAGADPTMERDRVNGKTALEYLGEHLVYDGKGRFQQFLKAKLMALVGVETEMFNTKNRKGG